MKISQMKCFVRLAATKKLTETANMEGIRASTVSKYLDGMEDEIKAELFHRSAGGIELTKEGELIYPSISFIVKQYDDMMAYMSEFSEKHKMQLKVALQYHQNQILKALMRYMELQPDVIMNILESPAQEIQDMLDMSNVDIAIIYEELLGKKQPWSYPMRKDKMVAVVGKNHRLAGAQCISISDLKSDVFIFFKGDALMYRYQVQLCISAGFAPAELHHNLRQRTILECAACGNGVSIMPLYTTSFIKTDDIVLLPLEEEPTLTMSIVCPKEYPSEVCKALIKYLVNSF